VIDECFRHVCTWAFVCCDNRFMLVTIKCAGIDVYFRSFITFILDVVDTQLNARARCCCFRPGGGGCHFFHKNLETWIGEGTERRSRRMQKVGDNLWDLSCCGKCVTFASSCYCNYISNCCGVLLCCSCSLWEEFRVLVSTFFGAENLIFPPEFSLRVWSAKW